MADSVNRSVNIFFNEAELSAALARAQTRAAKLEQQMKDVGDKSSPEFLKLQQNLENTNKKIGTMSEQLTGKLAPSFKQLQGAVQKAYNEMQNLPIGSPEWKAKVAEFDKLNGQFIKLKNEVGQVGRVMQTFGSQIKTIGLGVLIGNTVQAGAQAVLGYFQGMISGSAKIADELSDIQKTTGLTNEEVKELNKELSKIDTRTSSSELRQIAAVGGQFNIAKKDLAGFTAAIDKANVALGDEFGGSAEDVATQLTKLRNIFTDVKTEKTDQDLLHISNALNSLGNAGAATSDVVADFSNRIAGVGIPLGLSTAQVLGISATLQELGVNAERGGTAVSKILQKMTINTDEFAKVAGLSVNDFTKLLNTDLYKAFQLVVEGSNKAGGSATAMANLLKDAELSGAGAAEVFLKLSSNTELMGDKVKLAGTALKSTDSIMQEFNSKNNNFAANLEKIQKRMAGFFAGFGSLLEGPVAALAGLIQVQDDETIALEATRKGLEINLIALQDTNLSTDARKKLIEQTNEQYADYLPHLITEKDTLEDLNKLQNESNKLLKTKILTISFQKELSKVFEDQAESIRALAEAEILASKRKAEAGTGTVNEDPAFLQQQKDVTANAKLLNQSTIDNTDKLANAVRDKFKLMARFAGVAFEDLEKVVGGTVDKTKDKVKTLGIGPTDKEIADLKKLQEDIEKLRKDFELNGLTADEKEFQQLKDKYAAIEERAKGHYAELFAIRQIYKQELAQLGDKQFDSRSEKEYQASLNALKTFFEKQKLILKQNFADGLIDEEAYQNGIIALNLQEGKAKIKIAEDYKDTAKTATADLNKFKTDSDNAEADAHIAANKKKAKSDKDITDEAIELAKKKKDEQVAMAEAFAQAYFGIVSAFSSIEKGNQDIELARDRKVNDDKKEALKKRLEAGTISQEKYNAQIAAIDKKQRDKEAAIKKEQFKADKAAKIIEAIINTAVAVVKALPNIPLSVLAGVTGAATIATIAAQPIPEFGAGDKIGKKLKGPLHNSKSRGIWMINPDTGQTIAKAEGNEWLLNQKSSDKYDSLLDAVNRDDSAAINKWFMNRPSINLSGLLDNMKIYNQSSTGNYPVYDDGRLRKTLQNGFIESSKFIVGGVVSGLHQGNYAQSRRV